jgi:hypothetical protein
MPHPGRPEIIGALILLLGVALLARVLWRVAQVVRARFTQGAPYRRGQIADRLLGIPFVLPIPLIGAGLVFLGLAQTAFQPTRAIDAVQVGRVEAVRGGWGRTRIRLSPDPSYPERRLLEGEIDGARWALVGEFIDFAPGIRWLGLRPGHRVRALVGSADVSGTSPSATSTRVTIDALPRAAGWLLRVARYLPFLKVREAGSAWYGPAERRIVMLYATTDGYLADGVADGAAPR